MKNNKGWMIATIVLSVIVIVLGAYITLNECTNPLFSAKVTILKAKLCPTFQDCINQKTNCRNNADSAFDACIQEANDIATSAINNCYAQYGVTSDDCIYSQDCRACWGTVNENYEERENNCMDQRDSDDHNCNANFWNCGDDCPKDATASE